MTILEYCAVQAPSTSPGARLVCAGGWLRHATKKKSLPGCNVGVLFCS